jgi:flagellar transcriptional activator FlhD
MNDIISINRQFLIMAREAANSKSGEIITGLSRPVLDRLSNLSLDQIEAIVQGAGVSLITFRLSEADLTRLTDLQESQRAAYSLAVVASERR